MDISAIKPNTYVLEMLHPSSGAKLGIAVTIVSINDQTMKSLKNQITNTRLKMDTRGKSFKADEVDDNRRELAATAIKEWNWYDGANFHGESTPECNRKTKLEIFTELPWFLEQVEEAISEEKNFFTA